MRHIGSKISAYAFDFAKLFTHLIFCVIICQHFTFHNNHNLICEGRK